MSIDCHVTEFDDVSRDGPVPQEPYINSQKLSVTTSARLVTAFAAETRYIRIMVRGGDGFFKVGDASVTATVNDEAATEGVEYWRDVRDKKAVNIAFYDGSS